MRKRKYEKSRRPRRVILVLCEGETEAAYVDVLRKHYRIPITVKSKIVGSKVNERLVNKLLKEEGLYGNDESIVVFMYDADVKEVVIKLKALKGNLILSNPCIEFWYLLHCQSYSRALSSKEAAKILEKSLPVWMGYAKGVLTSGQREFLLNSHKLASSRAKILEPESNPSSNMYLFLEILESEKKA